MYREEFFEKRATDKVWSEVSMFSERLRTLRRRKGETQESAADKMGIPKATYGTYENGKYFPDAEKIAKMADFFNVSADYLLGLTDSPVNKNDDNAVVLNFDAECIHSLTNISRDVRETRAFQLLVENHMFEEVLRYIDTYLLFSQRLAGPSKEYCQKVLEPYKKVTRINVTTNDYLPADVYPDGGVKIADIYLSLIQENLKNIIDNIPKKYEDYYREKMQKYVSEEAAKH